MSSPRHSRYTLDEDTAWNVAAACILERDLTGLKMAVRAIASLRPDNSALDYTARMAMNLPHVANGSLVHKPAKPEEDK